MKEKFISLYFDVAERVSHLSHAQRLKVGAVVVKDDRILSYGYNGTPAGFDNCCEIEGTTRPEVVHAEMNAIAKIAKYGDSCEGATMFITHAPCIECAKMILQSGIVKVYYKTDYRSMVGVNLLNNVIEVIKHESSNW